MKKWFSVMVLVFLISISATFGQSSGEGEKNFQQAGQAVLQHQEEILQKLLNDVDSWFEKMTADNYVSIREMTIFSDKIRDFQRAKTKAEKSLKFYHLETSKHFSPDYETMVAVYKKVSYGDNGQQDIKEIVVQKTGRDVRITHGYSSFLLTLFFFFLLTPTLVPFIFTAIEREWRTSLTFGLLFVGALVIFIIIVRLYVP